MAYTGSAGGFGEPGARRKKLAGYLKAANELRQSYFSQDPAGLGARDGGYDNSGIEGPGAFPDAAIVRSGNEEMVLFPSYARKHTKRTLAPPPISGEVSEQEYWRREWERQENDRAIVDVGVRGWIFTPQRGPANRRQRLMIGIARQMVGLPGASTASANKPGEASYSSQTSSRSGSPVRNSRQDEDLIELEAENIIRKGEKEEQFARRGEFSERPNDEDGDSDYSFDPARDASLVRGRLNASHKRLSQLSLASSTDGDVGVAVPIHRRASWTQPANMTAVELETANKHLLNRLKYFMANPLVNAPISALFFNESNSRQITINTNAAGHFSLHAPLEFIPTHVRILAAEKLSATEEVIVTAPRGVSVISDIDDTIKHSGIGEGARNIFRNAFIRELHDLTIDGVKEWYNTMHDMGVNFHYVSNSPWQLYPMLATFFKLAHLPRGSFHLKQYSGMLQGIFEPVAERKKASLETIFRDFPERKFILIGDSGEADLEVYTDVALDNPGKVLGIFIRDVTTTVRTGYFDPSNGSPGSSGKHSRSHSRQKSVDSLAMSKRLSRPEDTRDDNRDLEAAIAASLADMEVETSRARRAINPDNPSPERIQTPDTPRARPDLPPRRQTENWTAFPTVASPEEDLIDFSEDFPTPNPAPKQQWLEPPAQRPLQTSTVDRNGVVRSKPSPSPPPKPRSLRSPSAEMAQASAHSEGLGKPPPPRPRKPSATVRAPSPPQTQTWDPPPPPKPLPPQVAPTQFQPSPLSQVTQQSSVVKEKPPLPSRRTAPHKAAKTPATGQNVPPNPTSNWSSNVAAVPSRPQTLWASGADSLRAMSTISTRSMDDMRSSSTQTIKPAVAPPPPPRRRNVPSFSTSAQKRRSGTWDDMAGGGAGGSAASLPGSPSEAGVSKKEFLWNQRWARAKSLLEPKGVTLRTWRTGVDVADVAVKLAEQEMRKIEWEQRNRRAD